MISISLCDPYPTRITKHRYKFRQYFQKQLYYLFIKHPNFHKIALFTCNESGKNRFIDIGQSQLIV